MQRLWGMYHLHQEPKCNRKVTVSNVPTSQTTLVMDAGTTFSTSVNDTTYNFVTISDHTATSDTGIFQFDNIPIYEGLE